MRTGLLICLMLLLARPLAALEITALQPGAAQPGTAVILTSDEPFPILELRFGDATIPLTGLSPGVFRFQVPELPPGEYALSISTGPLAGTSPPFPFQVRAMPPEIGSLVPDTFSFCRGAGPEELIIEGTGFVATSAVLLNGSRIPVSSRTPGRLVLRLPAMPVGLHKIQVANPDGQESLPVTLSVVRQPVIHMIESGGDAITSYRLTVHGENFSPNSRLLLNGSPLPQRRDDVQNGDRVSYIDCTTLVYQRHPMAGQPQDLEFRVVNPDGQVSNSYPINGY